MTDVSFPEYVRTTHSELNTQSLGTALKTFGNRSDIREKLARKFWPKHSENIDPTQDLSLEFKGVNWGQLEVICRGQIENKPIGSIIPFLTAVSRGLVPESKIPVLENAFQEALQKSGQSNLYSKEVLPGLIRQSCDRQVAYDFHALSYLHDVFEKHNISFTIPEPYWISNIEVAHDSRSHPISIPVLIGQWLEDAAEINVIGQNSLSFNRRTGTTHWREIFEPSHQHELKTRTADLLSSVYFATGCLPGLWTPQAGDVIIDKTVVDDYFTMEPDHYTLGLITVRGGLVPLEDYSHEYVLNRSFLANGRIPLAKCHPVEKPDSSLLHEKLSAVQVIPTEGAGLPVTIFHKDQVAEGIERAWKRFQ